MKISQLFIVLLAAVMITQCTGKGRSGKTSENDTISVPDTGFTGIKRGMSGQYVVNEITYENGVREGLGKTFYQSGKVRTTTWYVKGLVQDSICWFYEEGQLFRITPYKNDTIHGVQRQYYRSGELKARIGFTKGLRNMLFEEYAKNGKLINNYPDIAVNIKDSYSSTGTYRIMLTRSDKSPKVRFYRGEFTNGVFDTARVDPIKVKEGTGYLDLKKKSSAQNEYVGVIAEMLTDFGNNKLVYKKIELPYRDID